MSLLREPPEKIAMYAMAAYLLAAILTVFNVACSYFYFRNVAPGGGVLGFVVAIGVAALVNVIETGTTMIFLSADEVGHLFTPPKIQVPGFPALAGRLIKFGLLGLFGFVLCWTYKVDLESTESVLQAQGSIGTYVVFATVFGSEFLVILGHALWGMSKFGKANTQGMWKNLNAMIGGKNVVPMPGRSSASTPSAPGAPTRKGGLLDEVPTPTKPRNIA